MSSKVTLIKDYAKSHKKTVFIAIVATVILEVLICAGLVPTYNETDLSRKFTYFFPVWVIAALYAHAVLSANIRSDAPESDAKKEQ